MFQKKKKKKIDFFQKRNATLPINNITNNNMGKKSNKGRMKKIQRREDKIIKGFYEQQSDWYKNYISELSRNLRKGVWNPKIKLDSDYLEKSGFNNFVEESLGLTEFPIVNIPIQNQRVLLLEGFLFSRCYQNSSVYSEQNENWVSRTGFSVLKYKNKDSFMLEHHTVNFNTETGEYKDITPDLDDTIENRLFIEDCRILPTDLTRFQKFQEIGLIDSTRNVMFQSIRSDRNMSYSSEQLKNLDEISYSYRELLELKEQTQHIQMFQMD